MHHTHRDDLAEDLHEQLSNLSQEVAALKKQLMRRSWSAYREGQHIGGDVGEMLRDYFGGALPEIRRGAYRIQKSARENPATTAAAAAAAVIMVGLAASLLLRR